MHKAYRVGIKAGRNHRGGNLKTLSDYREIIRSPVVRHGIHDDFARKKNHLAPSLNSSQNAAEMVRRCLPEIGGRENGEKKIEIHYKDGEEVSHKEF